MKMLNSPRRVPSISNNADFHAENFFVTMTARSLLLLKKKNKNTAVPRYVTICADAQEK